MPVIPDDDFDDVRDELKRSGRLGIRWYFVVVGVIVITVAAIAIGNWLFNTGTSDIKGRGDAARIKNEGQNRVDQQAKFQQIYNAIQRLDLQIGDAKVAWDASPDDAVLRTNYLGFVNQCRSATSEYDTLARTYTAQEFRDADLPEQIDQSDPQFDCKP